MVNLSKSNTGKPLREYTPSHICDEYSPATNSDSSNTGIEYKPLHIRDEILTANASPVIDVAPPKHELATTNQQNLTYTQAIANCRSQYLASVFQRASDYKISALYNSKAFQKWLKRHIFSSIALGVVAIAGFLSLVLCIGTVATGNTVFAPLGISLCATGISAIIIWGCENTKSNDETAYDTIKKATDVFVSPYGANTDTINYITECRQRIECEVIRPSFCKDDAAYETVTRDKHDVFVIYSDKTKRAVIIDPKLFE